MYIYIYINVILSMKKDTICSVYKFRIYEIYNAIQGERRCDILVQASADHIPQTKTIKISIETRLILQYFMVCLIYLPFSSLLPTTPKIYSLACFTRQMM